MSLFDLAYQSLIQPILFRFDPETIHERVLQSLRLTRMMRPIWNACLRIEDVRLQQDIWGYTFKNPIGLAGGFDKNALCADLWEQFGFGFFEIGTITPRPQAGNPKPRLFRYPNRQALVNRMGFNNDGSEAIAERLKYLFNKGRRPSAIMGVSIGKQKETPADDSEQVKEDYIHSLQRLYEYGDFFVVNVSSPNTPDLRSLQDREPLSKLLYALKEEMYTLHGGEHPKPLCVKLAPDLSDDALREAVDVSLECGVDGIIATNTTLQTGPLESGGLSGKPLRERSTAVIQLIANHIDNAVPIIGCGGIFSAEDVLEKIQAGASLVQIYTSFVYQGPGIVKTILTDLLSRMDTLHVEQVEALRQTNQD